MEARKGLLCLPNSWLLICNVVTCIPIRLQEISDVLARKGQKFKVKSFLKKLKNVEIVEFHDHIWNHNEKCIQISTNMPGFGSLIREIAVEISEMWENEQTFAE